MKNMLVLICLTLFTSCKKEVANDLHGINFREEMRLFVQHISEFARKQKPDFLIVPQNGLELLTATGNPTGAVQTNYVRAINGVGREELFYGYDNHDGMPTPTGEHKDWLAMCSLAKENNLTVLVTDYVTTGTQAEKSNLENSLAGFVSYASFYRNLDDIPPSAPFHENALPVTSLSGLKNFLYLINTASFSNRQAMLESIKATNYDGIILDLFFQEGDRPSAWTAAEIQQMKFKKNGSRRLVLCYLSIGEAEDYRYYWKPEWAVSKPSWLENLNPQWAGNYKVKYWMPAWQQIIYGNTSSYLQKIIDAGFDGAYLDIIDAFEYWETL